MPSLFHRLRQAPALWAQIDRSLADQAASLPMINERGIAFLSAGIANYQSHPYWGVIADQLWVKVVQVNLNG